ncbi:MAG: hypothetical protein ABI969_12520, partial [bacterium]
GGKALERWLTVQEGPMRRAIGILLALPLSTLLAQSTPLQITVTAPNNALFRVARLSDDPASRAVFGRGRWEIRTDSATVETMAYIAADPATRIHVEVSERGRVVASGDGAYVSVRRDSGVVSLESRNRAPASPPGDVRQP